MAKEVIRFKGLSLNKDEQSASHGELALCANVELHDGALRPSVLEGSMVQHEVQGEMVDSTLASTLKYVHDTPSYRHFIGVQMAYNRPYLFWYHEDGTAGTTGGTPFHTFDEGDEVISIESVGNTLVVLNKSGVHYILWKSVDEGYKYIGNQIPFLDLKFRPSENHDEDFTLSDLVGKVGGSTAWDYWEGTSPDDPITEWSYGTEVGIKESYKSSVSEGIKALVNKINHEIAEKDRFYAPFLIRYCYRLYDGSITMHSAPVFMNISSPKSYRVYTANLVKYVHSGITEVTNLGGDYNGVAELNGQSVAIRGFGFVYKPNNVNIRYSTIGTDVSNTALNSLKEDWSDIVKSIDIFVSPMMAREKIDELIESAKPEIPNNGIRDSKAALFKSNLVDYDADEGRAYPSSPMTYEFAIPMASDEEYTQRLKDCSTFYKIKSFDIKNDTIGTDGSFADLEIDENAVLTLTSQEMMERDEYHTHNKLTPISSESGMYVYNHRLNLFGMQEQLFQGFNIATMINEADPIPLSPDDTDYLDIVRVKDVYVELETEDGKKYVHTYYGGFIREYCLCNALFYYPDSRATKMMIYYSKTDNYMLTLSMEPCNFLNGAVSTSLFYKTQLTGDITAPAPYPPSGMDTFPMPNKILTSEVDDPYFFPVEGRNSVGNGKIKGVGAVTRALSQGQVGDHDLIAFSTDGIWVMKVASTGLYSAIHNISREVCSNPKTICQLDQSVVFATERNLSRFVESDVLSISEVLDGPIPNWSTLLPTLVAAFPSNGTVAQQTINKLLAQMPPAVQLFNQGSVFYDYASKRIVVLPAANAEGTVDAGVAMVFSIRDEAWSTMAIPNIKAVIPGYPSPFVQLGDGKVMILDKTYGYAGGVDTPTVPGLIITRTLTFSDTMDVIRGYTQYADSAVAPTMYVFGSNDQRSWQSLGTSNRWFYNYMPGRPYRFFRIAVYMQMKPSEEYQQVEMEAINKYAKL